MSFASLLRHTLVIERPYQDDSNLDDYGQPVREYIELATVKGLIQPLSTAAAAAREVQLVSQGGAALTDHTIFLAPTDVTTADRIVHEGRYFEINAIRDGGGQGHHLEVAARLVTSPELDVAP